MQKLLAVFLVLYAINIYLNRPPSGYHVVKHETGYLNGDSYDITLNR
jgi:hypothetical protein